ncbi:MAG TPA: pyridoxamine 5'-phosphate oxidase family protein [Kineosporiaceae bacterium]|jgi:hypothetical protein|nr:pyridoxamine 5'-phosphate oxidase family protein [Kineosporiaceae bacterium]
MSVKVELPRLLEVAAGFETVPLLLTTDADGRPRASAVGVDWQEDVATIRAGHRSVANAAERPLVSLLWPAPPGQRFALFVDGTVEATAPDPAQAGEKAGGFVTLRATRAILHVVDRPH